MAAADDSCFTSQLPESVNCSLATNDSLSRYSVLRKCLEDVLHTNEQTVSQREDTVSWQQYKTAVLDLESEKAAHAKTKAELVETQDRLAYALGEIEILQKQIAREKLQFEKTFGALADRCPPKQGSIQDNCLSDEEASGWDRPTVKLPYSDELTEINVQLQQQLYISQLLQGSKTSVKCRPTAVGTVDRDIVKSRHSSSLTSRTNRGACSHPNQRHHKPLS